MLHMCQYVYAHRPGPMLCCGPETLVSHRLGVLLGRVGWEERGVGVAGRRRAKFACIVCNYWLFCGFDRHDDVLLKLQNKFYDFIVANAKGLRGARRGQPLEDASRASIRGWNRWRWF